ncbi:sulfotransferase domain-containing protein [Acidisoma sp.]|uniref:sulfotransferase domain-containing protein n=1 Tax=Acidisoma sp. TaxID=1872115 RepID=UPI003B01005A
MGQIIWIASYPKSGSTWLRAFLHNYARNTEAPHDINSLMDLTTGESSAARYRRHDPRPPVEYSIADVQRMRPLVHHALADAHPGLVFVKTHSALLVVAGVQTITKAVTSGAIYILRDPRDVAISYSRHLDRSIDDTIAVMADVEAATGGTNEKVYERLSSWSAHVHFWTRRPHADLHVMRYEDMVEAPVQAFGSLIRFLGDDPPQDRLERAVAFSDFSVLAEQERSRGFIEQPARSAGRFFRSGKVGQWREVLTRAQAARIEQHHGEVMRRFGYLP